MNGKKSTIEMKPTFIEVSLFHVVAWYMDMLITDVIFIGKISNIFYYRKRSETENLDRESPDAFSRLSRLPA